jgi:hypothetical protein
LAIQRPWNSKNNITRKQQHEILYYLASTPNTDRFTTRGWISPSSVLNNICLVNLTKKVSG